MTTRSLQSLHRGIQRCRRCRLHAHRRHAVPGEGDARARAMLVGEAPGEAEDASGRPFVGRAGRFLDELLAEVGLERAALYLTSSVKCRPPDNREPRQDELQTCTEHWLRLQIERVDPGIIVLLGRVAIRALLGEKRPLVEVHGLVVERAGRRFLLTYHPAAGMRFPAVRARMVADLDALARRLAED